MSGDRPGTASTLGYPKIRLLRGFTLIEMMIVAAIIGVLAAIAIPKFANLARKSNEGATKGNLGSIRSALSIYYAEMEGNYPADLNSLTIGGKYLAVLPNAIPANYHPGSSTVGTVTGNYITFMAPGPPPGPVTMCSVVGADNPGWAQVGVSCNNFSNLISVNCTHTDTKGTTWSSY